MKSGRLVPLILLLVSVIVVGTWFREGIIYAGAEVGLSPYYNPDRFLQIQQFTWWDDVAPGMLVPHFINAVPLYFLLSILQPIFSPLVLQAALFCVIFFLIGYGIYLLATDIFEGSKKKYAIFATLFYMFNSYTLVQVWHRFLYSSMILAATLPFIILYWRKWIREGKFIHLSIFLLINFLSVYMYGNLATVITVWTALLLISLAEIFLPWQGKYNAGKLIGKFLTGFIFWLLTNIWWITPTFSIAPGLLSSQHSNESNIDTLVSLGRQTVMPYLLQLANPFYLFYRQELGEVYSNTFFRIMPWIMSALILIGLFVSLKLKNYAKIAVIFIVSLLLSKGASSPFSFPFIFGFEHSYFLGVIRNPFEKLGIFLPLFGSIIFAIGLESFYKFGVKRWGLGAARFVIFIIISALIVYAWPMLGGRIFGNKEFPVRVKVQESYIQANEWFKQQKENQGVILHLPFSGKDVVTYDWKKGYHGVEQNEILFTTLPSLSRTVGIKRVDDTLNSLTYIFNQPFLENEEQILRVLQSLNIRYIVLHKDTKWEDVATYGKDIKLINPFEMEISLDRLNFLKKDAMFDELVIYSLKSQFYQPKIVFFDTAELVYPGESDIMQIMTFTQGKNQTITAELSDLTEPILSKIEEISIFPQDTLQYSIASESALMNMASNLLIDPNNPASVMGQLKAMKAYFYQPGQLSNEDLLQQIIVSGETLVRYFNLIRQQAESNLIFSAIENYNDSLNNIFKNNFKDLSLMKLYKQQIANFFYLHLYILEYIEKQRPDERQKISDISIKLINSLKDNDLLPVYLRSYLPGKQEINRKILKYKIPVKSKYEIYMANNNTPDFYPDLLSKLDLRVNDKSATISGKIDNNRIFFGSYDFDNDLYEISYNLLLSVNLVPGLDEFLKVGDIKSEDFETLHLTSNDNGVAFLESPIRNVTGRDIYKISVDVLFKKGSKFYVEVIQNTEDFEDKKKFQTLKQGDCTFHNCYIIELDPGKEGWQNYTLFTQALNLASRKSSIRILIDNGEILIKNLLVNKVFDEDVVLKKRVNELPDGFPVGFVTADYQSPVFYSGKIRLDKPTFLFFKETFHPGWNLQLVKDGKAQTVDNHYLGNLYGNIWWVDNPGDFDFRIEFTPERNVGKGVVIAIVTTVIIVLINCFFYLKRSILRK